MDISFPLGFLVAPHQSSGLQQTLLTLCQGETVSWARVFTAGAVADRPGGVLG